MFRYRLRTLLILLAILPPLIWFGWTKYVAWRVEQDREQARQEQVQAGIAAARQKVAAARKLFAAESAKVEARVEAHRAERQDAIESSPKDESEVGRGIYLLDTPRVIRFQEQIPQKPAAPNP